LIPRERVLHAFHIEECDRIPIGEELIDGRPTLERVLGRTPVHANFDLKMRMLAAGKRDNLIKREKKDVVDLIEKLKLDIYMVFSNTPKDYVKPVEIEKNKWLFDKDLEEQKTVLYAPSSDMTFEINSPIRDVETFKEYVRKREQEEITIDPTSFEVLEHVTKKLGEKVFITSMVGGGLPGFGTSWFPILLRCFFTNPDYVKRLIRVETKHAIEYGKALIDAGAEGIAEGSDYAGHDGLFISPRFFKDFCLPELKRLTRAFHRKNIFTIQDTDGNIWPIAKDLLIEAGFDVYFAIEPRAGMVIAEVKEAFGDKVCLWGNIDDAYTLPFGDENQVIEETKNCINATAPGGGYILASSCTIHKSVKPENYFTMLKTGRKNGKYKIN
jgi:hypothetical protein